MNKGTLDALNASIAHYERLLTGEDTSIYDASCALCIRFGCGYCELTETGEKCPVGSCTAEDARWIELNRHIRLRHRETGRPNVANCKTCVDLLTKELEFLKSLRPPPDLSQGDTK